MIIDYHCLWLTKVQESINVGYLLLAITNGICSSQQQWLCCMLISTCSARDEKETNNLETQFAVVYSHGLVHWWLPIGQSVTHCPMDITWFPVDTQNCPLIYESWAMHSAQLNITPLEPVAVDLIYYQNSGEWHLVGNDTSFDRLLLLFFLFLCSFFPSATLC